MGITIQPPPADLVDTALEMVEDEDGEEAGGKVLKSMKPVRRSKGRPYRHASFRRPAGSES